MRPEFIVSTDFSYEQSMKRQAATAPEAAARMPPAAVGVVASAAGVERAVAATGAERAGQGGGGPGALSSAERTVALAMRPTGLSVPPRWWPSTTVALGVLAAARPACGCLRTCRCWGSTTAGVSHVAAVEQR